MLWFFFFLFSLYSPHFILSSLIFSSAHLLLIPPSVFFILDVFFITRSLILAIEKHINLSCFSLCYAFFCFNMRSISIIAMLISLITDSVIVVIFASVAPPFTPGSGSYFPASFIPGNFSLNTGLLHFTSLVAEFLHFTSLVAEFLLSSVCLFFWSTIKLESIGSF